LINVKGLDTIWPVSVVFLSTVGLLSLTGVKPYEIRLIIVIRISQCLRISALIFPVFMGFWVSFWWYGTVVWWDRTNLQYHVVWLCVFLFLHVLHAIRLNSLVHIFYKWRLKRAFYNTEVKIDPNITCNRSLLELFW
jgi:hypothetical protein